MTTPIDLSTLTPFAALVILGYLVFKYLTTQAEKKDEYLAAQARKKNDFTESIATKSMERADQSIIEMQAISAGAAEALRQSTGSVQQSIETMKELTRAIKEGDDERLKQLCAIGDMQHTIAEAHEDISAKRHRELVAK